MSWSEATRSRGSPDWASPRTSPSRRSSKSRLGQLEPVADLRDGLETGLGSLIGRVRHEDAERLGGAPADAATKLVELGQPEPVGPLDDHHRGLRDIDADLDDGRPDEDVELAVAEASHLRVAVGRLHPAVDHPDAERREQLSKPNRLCLRGRSGRVEDRRRGIVRRGVRLVDQRHDDERPMPGRRIRSDPVPDGADGVGMADPGPDRDAALRRRPQIGDVEVGVEDLAERPRDRRRRHQQDVRGVTAGLGLELAALLDAEAVLLVDDDDAEGGELDPLLDERVRPDDDGRHARTR